jgi:hypothetical protein
MAVVITVPHSFCKGDETKSFHYCDLGALNAAKCLNNKINHSRLFIADVNRRDCDLNRYQCRDREGFRVHIRDFWNTNDVKCVLDIHSFPDTEYKWNENEIVILDDQGRSKFSVSLADFLKSNYVKVALWTGVSNDIQDEAHERGLLATLIEFNETLSQDRLDYICGLISMFTLAHLR